MNVILEKYKDVQVLANEPKLREMQSDVMNWDLEKQRHIFAQDRLAGGILLYGDDTEYPGIIMEYVSGQLAEDSTSTLYKPHRIFANRGALIEARRELIQEIHRTQMVLDGMLAVSDRQRGRKVLVCEFTTAQLIDLLAAIDNTGYVAPKVI